MSTGFIAGIAISLFGSTASNLGVNVQKYSQVRNNRKPPKERKGYLKQPLWWIGLSMVILGALCDFGALSFAPQSVIMPVGSFTLVANVMFAHFWLGEALGSMDIMGTVLIVLGATLIAVAYGVLGKIPDEVEMTADQMMDLYKTWSVFGYGTCVLIMLVSFYVVSRQCEHLVKLGLGKKKTAQKSRSRVNSEEKREEMVKRCFCVASKNPVYRAIGLYFSDYENLRKVHPLSYAAVSGTMGSFSVVYGKSIGMLFANTFSERQNEFTHPYLYVCILCIVISVISQTHFLALGLKYFDALFIVPVFQCFFITLSILGGAIYWRETDNFNATQWFVFILGVLVVLWGVFLMSSRDMEVDGVSRRRSTAASDAYLPLSDGDVELSDDVRRRRAGIKRRNTAGEYITDASEAFKDAFRRPISILIDPELLNIREGYFGAKESKDDDDGDDDDSKEDGILGSMLSKRRRLVQEREQQQNQSRRRRRTERKVLGFLPVFLNSDLGDAGTALGFGLGFEDFGDPFSLRNRIRRHEKHPSLASSDSRNNLSGEKPSRRRVQTIAIETLNRSLIDGDEEKGEEEEEKKQGGFIPLDVEGTSSSLGLMESLTSTTGSSGELSDVTLSNAASSSSSNSSLRKGTRSKSFAL